MLPVFGGISGSTRTTLNTLIFLYLFLLIFSLLHNSKRRRGSGRGRVLPELARDELLQLHDVCRELADAFRRLLRRHRVVVEQISEFFLVHLESLDVRALRLFRIE